MRNGYFKYYKSKPLLGIIGIVIYLIILAKQNYQIAIPVLTFLVIIIVCITERWWHCWLFRWMFWIDDFRGTYKGKLVYFRNEDGEKHTGELEHTKTINQTGSRITITSFTKREDGSHSSTSTNKGIFVEPTEDQQHFRVIYTYFNEGSTEQGFPCHYGTEIIKFIKNGKEKALSGGYFTNRLPFQTKGEFKDLKWVSNNTKHEF